MEYVENEYGIKVRKICASCTYKMSQSDKYRYCDKKGKKTTPLETCDQYEIASSFVGAGKGTGELRSMQRKIEELRKKKAKQNG